ncbi:hypothetical protein [Rhodoferax sp.]|uniref:hypothetical protein n=1 Tax=Rhodoferax sp. TaxID=50421 RepID=UPI0008ADA9F9|nr:hypothetical protein [Rhodoferax sp.]MDO8319904.1 hypothetical protein [Rhodoferax sp.]MDP2679644.1 hypothetical protein [Rhodoferax sp.]OGB75617.1 MAG: hypothetical protein A2496_21050 [Burkholderiales bacterium RIFOXYC12_FULL_60_6]
MQTSAAEATGFKLYKLLNGAIIVLALLTVLEGAALTEWHAIATIFITLIANAVAEAFARHLADEIAFKRRPSWQTSLTHLLKSLVVVIPGLVPAVAFVAVSLGWLPLGSAFASACWVLVLALFAAGYAACRVNGSHSWRGVLYGTVISSFGLAIVALRLLAT